MSQVARGLLALLVLALIGGCEGRAEPEAEGDPAQPASVGDTVALTVYLRTGSSEEAMLQPVSREVPIEGNLTRRAVELLLEGPTDEDEGKGLESPWPEGTDVGRVTVDGGIATVNLSDEALSGAEGEGASHLEALALASLANTLTEFPTIERVRLTVDGQAPEDSEEVADFWGGWGLPVALVRDETLIGEDGDGTVPDLADFTATAQSVGDEEAGPVHVRDVRLRDRITYLRLVVELADAEDHDSSAERFPRAYARSSPAELALEITAIDTINHEGLPAELAERLEPYVSDLTITDGRRPDSMRVALRPATPGARDIHLHTRQRPSRIVLDVRKSAAPAD